MRSAPASRSVVSSRKVSTSPSWDATRLRIVTDGIAGSQWSAYLRVMWAGTRMEPLSSDVARNFGRVALLAGDITREPVRYADGAICALDGPGLGVDVDETALKQWTRG